MSTQLIESESIETNAGFPQTGPSVESPLKFQKIAWPAFLFIMGVHVAAITGLFIFSWSAVLLCLALHWITGGLGITLGFHRLLTHRSFKVPKAVEYLLAILGSLACQGGPIKWTVAHRLHHAYSDQEGDPHTPLKSFFWAHMGWCLYQNKNIDDPKEYSKVAPDLTRDPIMVFIDQAHILWTLILAVALYLWGGWPFVVWGIFVRLVLVYHATWFVNSAAHVWGYQTYKSKDQSTNLWWVALMTYGEGWHNNHHAFQFSARHGLQWWEFDLTYLTIRILNFLRLAKDIKIPAPRLMALKKI